MQLGDSPSFANEPSRYLGIVTQMSVNDLHRDVAPQTAVAGAVNRGHASVTEYGQQLVFIQLYAYFLRRFHARPVRMHPMVVPFDPNAQRNEIRLGRPPTLGRERR